MKYTKDEKTIEIRGVTEKQSSEYTAGDLLLAALTMGLSLLGGGTGVTYEYTIHTDKGDFTGYGSTREEARGSAKQKLEEKTGIKLSDHMIP